MLIPDSCCNKANFTIMRPIKDYLILTYLIFIMLTNTMFVRYQPQMKNSLTHHMFSGSWSLCSSVINCGGFPCFSCSGRWEHQTVNHRRFLETFDSMIFSPFSRIKSLLSRKKLEIKPCECSMIFQKMELFLLTATRNLFTWHGGAHLEVAQWCYIHTGRKRKPIPPSADLTTYGWAALGVKPGPRAANHL